MLAYLIEQIRQQHIYGQRPRYKFLEAAAKYLKENQHKASIREDARYLEHLASWIGDRYIDTITIHSLQHYIKHRRENDNIKIRTINYALQTVRRVLNLAASEWIDENGLSWLHTAPKIKLLKETDKRAPYPLSWEEQDILLAELPEHVKNIALFAINTGCREKVIRTLRWEWEVPVPELSTSVFIVPGYIIDGTNKTIRNVKNGEDRLVILNKVAKAIVDRLRGRNSEYVFTYNGRPIATSINNSAWQKATKRCSIPVRIHDLKHTFGRRLRAAGVSFEDRQDLLGHKSNRITTHYSVAELGNLVKATNLACDRRKCGTIISVLKPLSRQSPAKQLNDNAKDRVTC